jgi:hypothetical protein
MPPRPDRGRNPPRDPPPPGEATAHRGVCGDGDNACCQEGPRRRGPTLVGAALLTLPVTGGDGGSARVSAPREGSPWGTPEHDIWSPLQDRIPGISIAAGAITGTSSPTSEASGFDPGGQGCTRGRGCRFVHVGAGQLGSGSRPAGPMLLLTSLCCTATGMAPQPCSE